MGEVVDLTAQPYDLSETQLAWVEDTLASMTDEEKVGQLFINLFHFGKDTYSDNDVSNAEILSTYHIGGARYLGGPAAKVQELINQLQSDSRIPLLVAANCDSGGNGACADGTYIASGAQAEASGDPAVAYDAGLVSAREAAALGVNVNFGPCVDILTNWRNTIVNTRAYGTDAEEVIRYSDAYRRGLIADGEVLPCIKHFPGDGSEERDHHLVLGVNELSVPEWEESFGRVYRHHIDSGVEMLMAGHFVLPAYQRALDPSLRDEDMLPATLSTELVTELLKVRLGFNGLVVTDASHMVGLTSSMRREDQVPGAIAAGCDMFLFFNVIEEDFGFMLQGVRNGVITPERLDDAVRRVLGLKAKLNLHVRQREGTLLRTPADLEVVGCEDHLRRRAESADKSITLVKDTWNQLPITAQTHRRIRLYFLEGETAGLHGHDPAVLANVVTELERRGFEVTVNDGSTRIRGSAQEYRANVDAAVVVANVTGYGAQNTYRIQWKTAMSSDCPWYIHEVPTIFVSLNYTTHLHDLPMMKTVVNAYHSNVENIRATVDKITGISAFRGRSNELVWAGNWQSRL